MARPYHALTNRTVVHITGQEARTFLERVLTCHIPDVSEIQAQHGALLTPQGKIISDLFLYALDDGTLAMDLPTSQAEAVVKRLTLLKLRADVKFEVKDGFIVLAGLEAFDKPRPVSGAMIVCIDQRTLPNRLRILAQQDEWRQFHGHEGEWLAPQDAYDRVRIGSACPEFDIDYETLSVFPSDVNMDLSGAVDYRKGCFVGQEVVSRMKRKSEVRKRVVRVSADLASVDKGTPVLAEEKELGTVTSWSEGMGLALMRVDRFNVAFDSGLAITVLDKPADILVPGEVKLPANDT